MDINKTVQISGSSDDCTDERDGSFKSNVKDAEHPVWSSSGLIETINYHRKWGNTKEKDLQGEVPDSFFRSLVQAQVQTKVPGDLIAFCVDWDNDITSGGDAMGAAQQIRGYVDGLRGALGGDPMNADVFGAYALGGVGQLMQLKQKAEKQPEEEAQGQGGKKDDIIYKKMRNGKEVKRKWREAYDFFKRRAPAGLVTFSEITGSENKQ